MRTSVLMLSVLIALAPRTAAVPSGDRPGWGAEGSPLAEAVYARLEERLKQLEADGDFADAVDDFNAILDQVIAYAPAREKRLFRDAAFAVRLVEQLDRADESTRAETLSFLTANPDVARALVFAMRPKEEDPAEVFAVLDYLRQARGNLLNDYATLTAAICLVHDQKLTVRIGEGKARAPDPLLLFDYYSRQEGRMLFGVRNVPTELLVYVVDDTASINDMMWALDRYAGDTNVGARFFDIDYDYDHFRKGTRKKVMVAGWNLPNILKHGGVCADQAYFAASVGKAIGVPTTYTVGRGGDVAHAWVGFLQSDGRRAWWNFDTGRYEAYQCVRGYVNDPQTRRRTPDGYISVLADFVHADEIDRQFAAAMTDAAQRLDEIEKGGGEFRPPKPIEDDELELLRRPTVADQLALLELGLRACPGYAEGWFAVRDLATFHRLTLADKRKWAGVLDRLCGKWYPDFHLAILGAMIKTVDDVGEQDRMWNVAFDKFSNRSDLAAFVRMAQAGMWLEAGQDERAGLCYEDVVNRYANAGPFILDALNGASRILRDKRDGRRLLMLYERAWSLTKKPSEMADVFVKQSNWFRVGLNYADLLDEAGMGRQAAEVRRTIGMVR